MPLSNGERFLYFKLLGIISRGHKLSNEPKMGSIALILCFWRFVEKRLRNYLPVKKAYFGDFFDKN